MNELILECPPDFSASSFSLWSLYKFAIFSAKERFWLMTLNFFVSYNLREPGNRVGIRIEERKNKKLGIRVSIETYMPASLCHFWGTDCIYLEV